METHALQQNLVASVPFRRQIPAPEVAVPVAVDRETADIGQLARVVASVVQGPFVRDCVRLDSLQSFHRQQTVDVAHFVTAPFQIHCSSLMLA